MNNKLTNNPSRAELITDFVKTNPNYYIEQFQKIGSKPSFSFSFNFINKVLIHKSTNPILFDLRDYVKSYKPRVAFYAGSFNPFHIGHLDIVNQSKQMFDKVVIILGQNPNKEALTTEEIEKNNFVLTPGRYVGFADQEEDDEPFDQKMKRLTTLLNQQQDEGAKLDQQIAENLKRIGFV